ncbi:hypothetical protein [Buttiauxella noackiae]|uniref:hypothetical protein n=1 Tax=Buttiauxella noackiae TaxID=82992 RepID=UPI0028D23432|nr:hypothetical protein [Buttiauxella noackiae]
MAQNPNFKPVLLTKEQMESVRRIQDGYRAKSPLNVAPTLNAIVRGLVDKALTQVEVA